MTQPTRRTSIASRAKAPDGYRPSDYPTFAVTVDVVVLTMHDGRPMIALIRRGSAPYRGRWALPGGFKTPHESLDQAARRELREETGIHAPAYLEQFRSFGDPKRDPRMNVVTVVYVAVLPEVDELQPSGDARDAELHPLADVLDGTLKLAFDHSRIVHEAVEHLAERMEHEPVATRFLPEEFTLSQLRSVYELFWDERLDPANFRRSLLAEPAPFLAATGRRSSTGAAGGRPAELFRATEAWSITTPLRRNRSRRTTD